MAIRGKTLTTKQLADLTIWKAHSESGIRAFTLSLNASEVDQKPTEWLMISESMTIFLNSLVTAGGSTIDSISSISR